MQNNNGIHHYLYDDKGQRLMKGSMYRNGVVINAEDSSDPSFRAEPYTVYVNPYYIITHYDDYAQITKHYYKGSHSRRDCEAKGEARRAKLARPSHASACYSRRDCEAKAKARRSKLARPSKLFWRERLAAQLEGEHGNATAITPLADNPVEQDGIDLLKSFGQEENIDFTANDLYRSENLYADWVMDEEEYNLALDEIYGEGNQPTEFPPCFVSQYYPFMLNETDCNYAGVIYYYHPDYLGNVEYITDRDGEPYQYFHYSGFGEAVVENKANTGTHLDYFRFNGKELDPETGNYYYGARYYDPKVSVWLSVDPKAHWYPSRSPYNYTLNNPINMVDPNGMWVKGAGFFNNIFKSDERNGAEMSAEKHNGEAFKTETGWRATWTTSNNNTDSDVNMDDLHIQDFNKDNFKIKNEILADMDSRMNGDGLDFSGFGLALGGALGAGSKEVLDGSTFRLFNQKGTNFSPKLYSSGWGGGSAGQIKTYGTSKLTLGLNVAGKGLGLYNAYSINAQHSAGQIGSFQMFMEQGSNAYSTLGGIFGAAWGIGWEGGRAITNTSGYQNWKQDTWLPFRKSIPYIGY